MCGRAETEPAFPRYPNLPVLTCSGYEQTSDGKSVGKDRKTPPSQ